MEGREGKGDRGWIQLLYHGISNDRNGVAIAVSERFRDKISLVERKSDRLMSVRIYAGSKTMLVIAAYAPQAGCSASEINQF